MREINKLVFFSYDSLTIYDGGTSSSSMMGKYCGDSMPPSHISSSKEIVVHFETDGSGVDKGFEMIYYPTSNKHQFINLAIIMYIYYYFLS